MKYFDELMETVVDAVAPLVGVWFTIWHNLKSYVVMTAACAGVILLLWLAMAGAIWGAPAGYMFQEHQSKLIWGVGAVGLTWAHSLYKSRPTLVFILMTAALFFLAARAGNAGELTEAVAAPELKITPRGTGEDLQQALERARLKLPDSALAVGVECVPEPDGLINCSYLYRMPKGAQLAPVGCQDFSPYRLCVHNNTCYGEGAEIAIEGARKICMREKTGPASSAEYVRLMWKPLPAK